VREFELGALMEYPGDHDHPRVLFAERFALLYELAGRPVLKRLADRANSTIPVTESRRAVFVSAQRLSDWRTGRNVPARFDGLVPTLRVLIGAARTRHPGPRSDGLYSIRQWQVLWERAQRSEPARGDAARDCPAGATDRGPETAECPYRGLTAFGVEDSRYFFGRQRATSALLAAVLDSDDDVALTVLVGASGSGKTSLLHAGLVPALERGRSVVTLTPGRDPVGTLERSFDEERETPCVLIVDQFEELFTQCRDEDVRRRFVGVLVQTARSRAYSETPVDAVVVAVRADFYERCVDYPDLAVRLQEGQMVLGPMTRDEVRTAVSGPAALVGVPLEPGLVDIIVRDLGDGNGAAYSSGALPLLGHALLATWEARAGDSLTVRAYESVGGVRGAVARTAEAVWEALTPAEQVAARQILMRLVAVGDDGPDTRRSLSPPQVLEGCSNTSAGTSAMNALTAARLVTRDASGVELAHDAVFEAWPRLAMWLSEDRAVAVLHQRIDKDALEWERHDRDGSLLYRGVRLDAALRWEADSRTGRMGASTRSFLAAGRRHDRLARLRRRGAVTALALLTVLTTIAALTAHAQRVSADEERTTAQFAEILAQAARTQNPDPSMSARLSLLATQLRPQDDTARSMLLASQNAPLADRLGSHDGAVYSVAVGPGGVVASASYDRTIRLWNPAASGTRGSFAASLTGHTSWVTSVAFSPDGRMLASGSGDSTVRLWDIRDPARPTELGQPLVGHSGAVYMVAFSPDGRTLASAGDDGTTRLWNIENPRAVGDRAAPLSGHTAAVRTVAFSADGRTLATGSDDHTAMLWDLSDPAHPVASGRVVGHADTVHSVAFSPDGRLLVTGSDDHSVRLWRLDRPGSPVATREPLIGHNAAVWSVSFGPDGSSLVSASWDGTARVWSLIDPDRPTLLGKPLAGSSGGLTTAVFTRDGKAVVTGGQDGTVRKWALPTAVVAGHTLRVTTPVLDESGTVAVTASRDGTIALWRMGNGHPPVLTARFLSGGGVGVENVALSVDGSVLATAGVGTGEVQLWNVAGGTAVPAGPPLEIAARYTHELAFSPDGALLATAADDQSLTLWSLANRARPVQVGSALSGAAGWINAVAFSPDGRVLAAGSSDKTVRLWDVSRPERPGAVRTLSGHHGAVNAIAFSPDGRTLASGSDDQTIRVWPLTAETGDKPGEAAVLSGHTSTVRSVAFSPDGRILATGSDDQSVRIWDVLHLRALGGSLVPDGTVRWRVAFGARSDVLMATGEAGAVRVLDLDPHTAEARVCANTPDPSTVESWQQLAHGPVAAPCG
jgi:WD40 repeat protein